MLNRNEIIEKINASPEEFERLMEQGKYCQAKWLFYNCMATAVFVELDAPAMERLFGDQGAFVPELVKKAYEKAGGGIDRPAENNAENERAGRHVRFSFQKKRILAGGNAVHESITYSGIS